MWTCALAHPRCICSLQCLHHCLCVPQTDTVLLWVCGGIFPFYYKSTVHSQFGWKCRYSVSWPTIYPWDEQETVDVYVCVGVLLYFITFSPGSEWRSRNLVMPVVYLVAYLLKDLTLELFTQPALGESLTHNINLPPASSKKHRHFRLEPFRPPQPVGADGYLHHVRVREACGWVTA